jgi:hypothetical protein
MTDSLALDSSEGYDGVRDRTRFRPAHGPVYSRSTRMPGRTERLRQLIGAFNSRRFDEYAAAFDEDVVIEYPQPGERIHGRANALAMFGAFATAPTFDVWRIDASGDIAVVHATGHYPDSDPWYVMLEYQFAGDMIVRETA